MNTGNFKDIADMLRKAAEKIEEGEGGGRVSNIASLVLRRKLGEYSPHTGIPVLDHQSNQRTDQL